MKPTRSSRLQPSGPWPPTGRGRGVASAGTGWASLRDRARGRRDRLQQDHAAPEQHPARRDLRRPTGSDLAFQGDSTPSPATTTGSSSTTSATRRRPKTRQPGPLPGVAERHQRQRQPAVPVHRLLAHRRQLRERDASRRRSRSRGRASRSSTSRTSRPRGTSRRSRPSAGRTPTPWSRARARTGRLPLRLELLAQRDVPGLPAAARHHLDRQGPQDEPGGRERSWRRPTSSPTAATRAAPAPRDATRRRAAATTSPSYPRRTSLPVRAWVTASSWT